MKGVVFDLLEVVVVEEYGAERWEEILEGAGVEGVYTSLGSYPDHELRRLIDVLAQSEEKSPEEMLRWYARRAMPHLSGRYPAFFAPHLDARSFVLTLNDIIHPEVRKLYPDAGCPDFGFDASDPQRLTLEYRSGRRMCAFAEGLLYGAGDHFGQRLEIEQSECMLNGDDRCLIEIAFPS